MTTKIPDDIMLPMAAAPAGVRPMQSRVVAFIPITIAILGVVAILLGRVTAHDVAAIARPGIDPIQTGAIHAVPVSGYGIDAVPH